jgi:prolyl-tRNA editing enzyme YbaK/EbsC (Cys-tRNA(Pro) deacylase)
MDSAHLLHPSVRQALDAIGAAYAVLPCDPELADTAAYCAHYGHSPDDAANAILVAGKTEPPRHALCVVLAVTRLDVNRVVRKLLDARKASFADAETTRRVTGMSIGGVTAFGLPAGLPVYVDARVFDRPSVIMGGGNRTSKLKLAPEALRRLPGATIVEGLAKPATAPLA